MNADELIKTTIGCFCLVLGIWSLSNNIKKTKAGWRSDTGTDIKFYALSFMLIIGGIELVYQGIFR